MLKVQAKAYAFRIYREIAPVSQADFVELTALTELFTGWQRRVERRQYVWGTAEVSL